MYVTQERIAAMLGVRRESITENALKLQKAGAIRYHRGLIKVLDRVELKSHCCECYSIVKTAFDNLKTENGVASTQTTGRTLTALQAQEWGTCESTVATFDALVRRPQLTEYKRDTASDSNGKSAR